MNVPMTVEEARIAELEESMQRVLAERDKANAANAEMREVLLSIRGAFGSNGMAAIDRAISSDCGKDYVHIDNVKPLVEALTAITEHVCELEHETDCECCLEYSGLQHLAEQSLAHAEEGGLT